jgi:hypothetical protein
MNGERFLSLDHMYGKRIIGKKYLMISLDVKIYGNVKVPFKYYETMILYCSIFICFFSDILNLPLNISFKKYFSKFIL